MSAPRKFLILGAGGHGKVLADVIRSAGHTLAGYVDLDPARVGEVAEPGGARVLYEQKEWLTSVSRGEQGDAWDAVAFGVGDNLIRLRLLAECKALRTPPIISPTAIVSPSAKIAEGTVVFPGAIINANARIGRGAIINTGVVVEHDCVVGDGAHISPNATVAGGVLVGELSWVGAGSVVIEQRRVGENAIVGAGAVVIRDIPANATAVGNPAKVIKQG